MLWVSQYATTRGLCARCSRVALLLIRSPSRRFSWSTGDAWCTLSHFTIRCQLLFRGPSRKDRNRCWVNDNVWCTLLALSCNSWEFYAFKGTVWVLSGVGQPSRLTRLLIITHGLPLDDRAGALGHPTMEHERPRVRLPWIHSELVIKNVLVRNVQFEGLLLIWSILTLVFIVNVAILVITYRGEIHRDFLLFVIFRWLSKTIELGAVILTGIVIWCTAVESIEPATLGIVFLDSLRSNRCCLLFHFCKSQDLK